MRDEDVPKKVRGLNRKERYRVITSSANWDFWEELWRRSKLWQKIIGGFAVAAVAFVNFGTEFIEACGRLLRALGSL